MAEMTIAEMQAQIAKLQADNAALKAARPGGKIHLKVSEKGAVSIYGLSARFPVTLYKSQIDRLFSDEQVAAVRQFVKDNEAKLATKPAKVEAAPTAEATEAPKA